MEEPTEEPTRAQSRFRFAWSRTQQDQPYDFVADDGDLRIGRVYRIAGAAERWKWNMFALGTRLGSTAGTEATRDAACDMVERAYGAMKAAIPIPDQE